MALKATICKAGLSIGNIDGGYYRYQTLTIARHSFKPDEYMMMRLLAFALCADETF